MERNLYGGKALVVCEPTIGEGNRENWVCKRSFAGLLIVLIELHFLEYLPLALFVILLFELWKDCVERGVDSPNCEQHC